MSFRDSRVVALLVLIVTFICFGTSLRGEFVADDYLVVVGNTAIRSLGSIPQLFTHSYFSDAEDQGLYRPVSNVTFALNYQLGRLNPLGYHLFNLLIHALNGFLVFLLVRKYTSRDALAIAASLLFVAHPVHVEPVSNIAGRPEMLAGCGLLLAWWFYVQEDRRGYWLALAAFALGLFSKENAIVLPVLLILADFCSGKALEWRKYAGFVAVAVAYLAIRVAVLHQVGLPAGVTMFKDAPLMTRAFTMSVAFMRYFKLMVWPRELLSLYDFSVIPITNSLTPPVGFGIALISGLTAAGVALLWRQRFVAFAILFFFITIGPVSNILLPTGVLIADRLLYLPVCALCLLIAALLDNLLRRGETFHTLAIAGLGLALIAAAARDIYRNADWMNQIAYLRCLAQGLPNSPMTPTVLGELGARLSIEGEFEESAEHLKRAVELKPDFADAAYNAGIVLDKLHRTDESLSYLDKAARLRPTDVEIRNYYGSALLRANQVDRARQEFEAVTALKRTR